MIPVPHLIGQGLSTARVLPLDLFSHAFAQYGRFHRAGCAGGRFHSAVEMDDAFVRNTASLCALAVGAVDPAKTIWACFIKYEAVLFLSFLAAGAGPLKRLTPGALVGTTPNTRGRSDGRFVLATRSRKVRTPKSNGAG